MAGDIDGDPAVAQAIAGELWALGWPKPAIYAAVARYMPPYSTIYSPEPLRRG